MIATSYTLPCGCTPDASGYGYCAECTRKLRLKIWSNLTPQQKDYDRQFGGKEIADLEEDYHREQTGCSCHINPPCSYCTSKNDYDESDD